MYKEILEKIIPDIEDSIKHYLNQLSQIRTGRANPSVVENIHVDYYGSKTPIKQLATINVPEPRLIVISPWDKGSLAGIESAVRSSDLGFNPVNDGQVIRISIPPLTEERRLELVKTLNQKTEEARVDVRRIREDIWKEIQDKERDGIISEDDKFKGKDKLQKIIDEQNEKIEELRKKKEGEILTI